MSTRNLVLSLLAFVLIISIKIGITSGSSMYPTMNNDKPFLYTSYIHYSKKTLVNDTVIHFL